MSSNSSESIISTSVSLTRGMILESVSFVDTASVTSTKDMTLVTYMSVSLDIIVSVSSRNEGASYLLIDIMSIKLSVVYFC